MNVRIIATAAYGQLGPFKKISPGLYRSVSGRVHIVGEGNIGGKAEGLAFLDQNNFPIPGRTLFVADDFLGLPNVDIRDRFLLCQADLARINYLISAINMIGFPTPIAIRSSSTVEDQLGDSQAGAFHSTIFGKPLSPGAMNQEFTIALLEVLNSSYGYGRNAYLRRCFTEIPPLPVIIQELIGRQWSFVPNVFFPALSGIVNTATPDKVKVQTVFGFGEAAVRWGLGMVHEFCGDLQAQPAVTGQFNGEVCRLNLQTGLPDMPDPDFMYDPNKMSANYPEIVALYRQKAPELQRGVAQKAFALSQQLGKALDLEWALGESEVLFTQVRPIKRKKANMARPAVAPENIYFQTNKILGQGQVEVKNIIFISGEMSEVLSVMDDIRRICRQFPDSLIVWGTRVKPLVTRDILHDYLIHLAKSVLVWDYYGDDGLHHQSGPGTGLAHLALEIYDREKVIIYSDKSALVEQLLNLGRDVSESPSSSKGAMIEVKELPFTLQIAGDDESGWGLIY